MRTYKLENFYSELSDYHKFAIDYLVDHFDLSEDLFLDAIRIGTIEAVDEAIARGEFGAGAMFDCVVSTRNAYEMSIGRAPYEIAHRTAKRIKEKIKTFESNDICDYDLITVLENIGFKPSNDRSSWYDSVEEYEWPAKEIIPKDCFFRIFFDANKPKTKTKSYNSEDDLPF